MINKLFFISVFVAIISIFSSLFGIYHKIGDYNTGGSTLSLDTQNEIIYTIKNTGLIEIIDVQYPEQPQLISSYQIPDIFLGGGTNIIVTESLAYVLTFTAGIILVDISNPFNPQLIGSYNYYAKDLIVFENYAYLACSNHLYILDISNTLNPILVGEIYGELCDISYFDNKIYGVHPYSSNNLRIIDVSDPTEPLLLSDFDLPIYSDAGIDVKETTAFIAYGQILWSIDVENPSNPVMLDTLSIPNHTSEVFVKDNMALVNASTSGFEVVDISNPDDMSIIGFYDTPGSAKRIRTIETVSFIADGNSGLQIIDIRDASAQNLLNRLKISRIANSLDYKDNYLYIGNDNRQIKIVSVSDFENPQLVTTVTLCELGGNTSVKLLNDIAYCTTDYPYFSINFVDISDPINSYLIGYDIITGYFQSTVCVNSSFAFIGTDSNDLYIYYETDFIGEYETADGINNISANDNLVFLAEGEVGVEILNINNNIHNPVLSCILYTHGFAHSVTINNNIIYISDGEDGILIYDVSDPLDPIFLSSIKPNYNSDIAAKPIIIDNLLYFFDREWNEFFIYNVVNPEEPVFVSSFQWNTTMKEFHILDDVLFSADSYYGVSIIDLTDHVTTQDEELNPKIITVQNYPNPFNPSTTIEFSILQKSNIDIFVYNIKGQKIKNLTQNEFDCGTHSIIWNGDDELGNSVSTGLYLYKINVNGKRKSVKKCVFLK